jgi:AraC-like DNA-binding protein
VNSSIINIEHFKPNALLSKYVRRISYFKSEGILQYRQKITPTPFCYLSFNIGDIGNNIINEKKFNKIEKYHIDGPKLSDDYFIEYNGYLERILVEFQASGFYYLFHHSPSKYSNTLVNLSEFTTEFTKFIFKELVDIKDRIDIIEKFLINKVHKAIRFNIHIENALHLFDSNIGNISVREVCDKINLSERHFNRTFKNITGVSPKQYSRLLQLHYIINLMNSKNYINVQNIAYDAKFYDPSHLSRSFKELTGLSPGDFINGDNHIALKYFSNIANKSE